MSVEPPRRAILLARLSDNREEIDLTEEGIPKSLDDQIQRMTTFTHDLGWEVWKVIKHQKLSAYKRRKFLRPNGKFEVRVWRPDLREALDDLWAGRANALVALDLDRAFRDGKDLQDLKDVVDFAKQDIQVRSVTGSLRMWRGSDTFDAEIRVAVANKSSRDTARRVSSARARRVKDGDFEGGVRRFGFEPDGLTVRQSEADEIKKATLAIIGGATIGSVVSDWRARDIATVKGGKWHRKVVREILLRPRNAGQILLQGKVLEGVKAPWEPIVTDQEFRAVQRKLKADSGKAPQREPKWLGSGIYLCVCGAALEHWGGGEQARTRNALPRYKCSDPGNPSWKSRHTSRQASMLDRFVTDLIVEWCCQDGVIEILIPNDVVPVDVADLNARAVELQAELKQITQLKIQGKINLETLVELQADVNGKLQEIDKQLERALPDSPVLELVQPGMKEKDLTRRRELVLDKWNSLSLGVKRAILMKLVKVQLLPTKSGPKFDTDSVKVTWAYDSDLE